MQFQDKVALVTGASSGIGEAMALRFGNSGAAVAAVGRNRDALDRVAQRIDATGGQALVVTGDLSDLDICRRVVNETVEHFGRLDALVNAAGIIGTGSIESTSPGTWREMMAINLDSVFHLMQLAAPHLAKTRGAIVNVSSVTGLRAFPNLLAYCVSKAAVDQLTRCAALDLAPKGVRVNAVNPGVVVTNLHRRSGVGEEKYQEFLKHSKTTHPLGRVGEPEEVAESILYLASEHAGWITGETLSIDGGRHLTCAR